MTDSAYLIPIRETLETAWNKVYGAKTTIWTACIIFFVIMFICGFLSGILSSLSPKLESIAKAFAQLLGFLLQMGLIYIGIKRAQDQPISYNLLFSCFKSRIAIYLIAVYLLQFVILLIPILIILGGTILYANPSLSLLGIALCVIGILLVYHLFFRMMLSIGLVLDKNKDPWEAIKLSFHLTYKNVFRLFLLTFLQALIVVISALPFFLGLIWTIPFSFILYGTIYKKLVLKDSKESLEKSLSLPEKPIITQP